MNVYWLYKPSNYLINFVQHIEWYILEESNKIVYYIC